MPSALGLGLAVDLVGKVVPCLLPPTITPGTPPATASTTVGAFFGFAVGASGCGLITYQWQRRLATDPPGVFVNAPGNSTGALYVTIATLALNGSQYRCIVTNVAGSVTSSIVNVTITP